MGALGSRGDATRGVTNGREMDGGGTDTSRSAVSLANNLAGETFLVGDMILAGEADPLS